MYDSASLNNSGISSDIQPGVVGNGGSIDIQARTLSFNNSTLYTPTFGVGNAGKIAIRAEENVSIIGANSRLYSAVEANGVGNGGEIDIQARNFTLSNGARLFTSTLGQGNSGNAQISTTGDITINNGAFIATSTLGKGSAGDATVTAGGQVILDSSGSGISTSVGNMATGNGGNINLGARNLSITNNASLNSTSSSQTGKAGDMNINAQLVRLDNGGFITAATDFSDGGNIKLKSNNYLLLRRGSAITTTAGFALGGGNGGNITIDTPFIVAIPTENSHISANAFTGSGGNINIQTL